MDPHAFDRISRAVGGMSRRKVAGAAGAVIGTSLVGAGARGAAARVLTDRDRFAAHLRSVLTGEVPFAPTGAPVVEKGKKKRKPCPDCDCSTRGGYVYGMTDTLCIVTYAAGTIRKNCQKAGLACAKLEAACKSGEACFNAFVDTWIPA